MVVIGEREEKGKAEGKENRKGRKNKMFLIGVFGYRMERKEEKKCLVGKGNIKEKYLLLMFFPLFIID